MGIFRKKKNQVELFLHSILVKTYTDYEHKVYFSLVKIPELTEMHPLFGEWDLLLYIVTQYPNDIDIENKMIKIEGIKDIKFLTRPEY